MSNWPKGARRWTPKEITTDCNQSTDNFRKRRLDEPKVNYLSVFKDFEKATKNVINSIDSLFTKAMSINKGIN